MFRIFFSSYFTILFWIPFIRCLKIFFPFSLSFWCIIYFFIVSSFYLFLILNRRLLKHTRTLPITKKMFLFVFNSPIIMSYIHFIFITTMKANKFYVAHNLFIN